MFPLFYSFLSLLLLLFLSPLFLLFSIKEKYRISIPSRFFLWKNWRQPIEDSYWFHGCSLGEVNSLKPFIKELQKRGIEKISISTTTDTGYRSAKSISAKSIGISYMFLPFEPLLWIWTRRQKVLIVVEAELWFLLFYIAKLRGAKTILLSGRLSDRSFPKYLKFRWFYRKIFQNIDLVLAQSEIDRDRLLQLGAKKIEIGGNIKLLKSQSTRNLNIPKDRLVIVGASTHSGEEIYILEAFQQYGKGRLILVPRHKERFDEVWEIVKEFGSKFGYSVNRYSQKESFNSDIVLIDVIGLLVDIYAKSDIVILGGSFIDGIGGHNFVEPASFRNKIVTGEYIFNQRELVKHIANIQIVKKEEIFKALRNSENLPSAKILGDIDIEKNIRAILDS